MFRPSRRRFTILLLLALAFVAPWHKAAEAAGPAASPGWQTWKLAAQLWSTFSGLWSEAGCLVDPSGVCGGGSQAEHGCSEDPNGRCAAGPVTATAESGCTIDPDGRCGGEAGSSATTGDHGCSSDPNGGCGQ
jgi:hypothetical protein